jgi:hypothetical protein
MKIFLCLLVGLVWLGAATAGEIADLHAELAAPVAAESTEETADGALRTVPAQPPEPGVARVGIERVPGLTGGPAYWVVIESDGDFRYVGESGVERLGTHTGTVPSGPLRLLRAFIEDMDFRELEDTYTSPFLDNPTTYLLAEWTDETKVIQNYALSGPARLWAMARLIDELLDEAQWDNP